MAESEQPVAQAVSVVPADQLAAKAEQAPVAETEATAERSQLAFQLESHQPSQVALAVAPELVALAVPEQCQEPLAKVEALEAMVLME